MVRSDKEKNRWNIFFIEVLLQTAIGKLDETEFAVTGVCQKCYEIKRENSTYTQLSSRIMHV